MDSILNTIKKMLGIDISYSHFDIDIIISINSCLMILNQLGVGPNTGYFITGDVETWDDYLESEKDIEIVKTFIYLKVKMMFDPPSNSFLVDAIERQIKEFEWRLNVSREKLPEEVPIDES